MAVESLSSLQKELRLKLVSEIAHHAYYLPCLL